MKSKDTAQEKKGGRNSRTEAKRKHFLEFPDASHLSLANMQSKDTAQEKKEGEIAEQKQTENTFWSLLMHHI